MYVHTYTGCTKHVCHVNLVDIYMHMALLLGVRLSTEYNFSVRVIKWILKKLVAKLICMTCAYIHTYIIYMVAPTPTLCSTQTHEHTWLHTYTHKCTHTHGVYSQMHNTTPKRIITQCTDMGYTKCDGMYSHVHNSTYCTYFTINSYIWQHLVTNSWFSLGSTWLDTAITHVNKVSMGTVEPHVNSNGVWHARLCCFKTLITWVIAVSSVWNSETAVYQ